MTIPNAGQPIPRTTDVRGNSMTIWFRDRQSNVYHRVFSPSPWPNGWTSMGDALYDAVTLQAISDEILGWSVNVPALEA